MRNFFVSIGQVSTMTLLSRVLGFTRDVVCAQVFGAVPGFDAFLVAFKIPNFMRQLFAEGAFSQAFVPVLSQHYEQQPLQSTYQFIDQIAGVLLVGLGLVVVSIYLFAPSVVSLFAPGFMADPLRMNLSMRMLRITIFYLPLISYIAFVSAILNVKGRFMLAAFVPTVMSVSLISAALLTRAKLGNSVILLAQAVPIAGIVQLLVLLFALYFVQRIPVPSFSRLQPSVIQVFKLVVGSLFGVAVTQISLFIDTFFASFLISGSISWLYYSERLAYFPVGVIAVAISTVTLPRLSRSFSKRDLQLFRNEFTWSINLLLFIAVPAAVGLALLAGPVLVSLLQYGQFSAHDVAMAQKSLVALSLGIPAFMLIKVLVLGFYARQRIRAPVKIAAIALGVNVICCCCFVTGLKHAGLALAVTVSSWVNVVFLLRKLAREHLIVFEHIWKEKGVIVVGATIVMAMYLEWFVPDTAIWVHWSGMSRIWHLCTVVIISVLVYLTCAYGISRGQLRMIYLSSTTH